MNRKERSFINKYYCRDIFSTKHVSMGSSSPNTNNLASTGRGNATIDYDTTTPRWNGVLHGRNDEAMAGRSNTNMPSKMINYSVYSFDVKNDDINDLKCENVLNTFSGRNDENIKSWLRQLKRYKEYKGITDESKYVIYASMLLRGKAESYYSALDTEPKNWSQFEQVMKKKYDNEIKDILTLSRIFFSKKQKNEKITEYAKSMYDLGISAELPEKTIVNNILGTLHQKYKMILSLHMEGSVNFEKLMNAATTLDANEDVANEDGFNYFKLLEDREKESKNVKNFENSQKISEEMEMLKNKLENLTLLVDKTKNHKNYSSVNIKCYNCGKFGHTSAECRRLKSREYSNNRESYNYKYKNVNDDNKAKDSIEIVRIYEKRLGQELPEKLHDFSKLIGKKTERLKDILEKLPKNFNTVDTICKNKELREELKNNIEYKDKESRKVNKVIGTYVNSYEILKCRMRIKGHKEKVIIDTGGATSVIPLSIAKRLNLMIDKRETNQELSLLGNSTIYTSGSTVIPLEVGSRILDCKALVADIQDENILLGNNWNKQNEILLDMKNDKMLIFDANKNKYDVIKTKCTRRVKDPQTKFFGYSEENITLAPGEEKILKIKLGKNLIHNNCVILTEALENKEFNVVSGINDVNSPPESIIVNNNSNNVIYIKKNEKLSSFRPIKNTKILSLDCQANKEMITKFNKDLILENFHGDKNMKNSLSNMLERISDTPLENINIEVTHNISITDIRK